jgi:uncharacterized protein (TIGR03083 family)
MRGMQADHSPDRPRDLAARLLLAERDALLPILRGTPGEAFDRPTVCVGWSVRDVLAHCGSALTRVAEGRVHRFTPEDNQGDVDERKPWPLDAVLAELERGYAAAAAAMTAAAGRLDGVALGEWIHGGDVREALGEPGAYESEGLDEALVLLAERSRRLALPATLVRLPDRELSLGAEAGDGHVATLVTDAATLIRLCSGRHPDPARLALDGADAGRYLLFR